MFSFLADSGVPAQTASTIAAELVSGSHVLTVHGYSNTFGLGLGVGGSVESGSFSVGGHAWNMVYYHDGQDVPDGSGDWISVGLTLRHTTAMDFKIRCSFSLLDHGGKPVPRYTTPCRIQICCRKGDGVVFPTFIRKDELEESACLIDDCFSIKCDVTVTKIRAGGTERRFAMVPASDMHEQFGRILGTGQVADVTFEVSGETFAAHRCVLAARSPVFMEQFLRSAEPRMRIDDIEPRVFQIMLQFIYTDSLPEIDGGETMVMAQRLFVAAHRYNLEKLKLTCENALCNCIDTGTVATALLFAEKHGCAELKKACFKFLWSFQNLKAMRGSDDFEKLKTTHPNILEELISKVKAP